MRNILVTRSIRKNGNGQRRNATFLSNHSASASNLGSSLECQGNAFRLKLATEISKRRLQEHLKRGDDPQVAAALAETAKWTFSREPKDHVF